MADSLLNELTVTDLRPVINFVAGKLGSKDQIESVLPDGLDNVRYPVGRANAIQLWRAVFEAALDEPPEVLASLFVNICDHLGTTSRGGLKEALREVGLSSMARITRSANPELGAQDEELASAITVPETTKAAQNLRLTALSVRRLLMRPLLGEALLQFSPTVLDPERRRMELADLAVDVVTATNYLLTLLGEPTGTSSPFRLATEAGSERGQGPPNYEAVDWLTRRRLDAQSAAVRLAQQLLAALRSDIAIR
jgi:hypothetical protein